jgi:hypothetical protein
VDPLPYLAGFDWGTAPDWVASAGTALATIIAVVLRTQVEARREATAAQFTRQARRSFAACGHMSLLDLL